MSLVERESDFMHNYVFTAPLVFESKSFESQSSNSVYRSVNYHMWAFRHILTIIVRTQIF